VQQARGRKLGAITIRIHQRHPVEGIGLLLGRDLRWGGQTQDTETMALVGGGQSTQREPATPGASEDATQRKTSPSGTIGREFLKGTQAAKNLTWKNHLEKGLGAPKNDGRLSSNPVPELRGSENGRNSQVNSETHTHHRRKFSNKKKPANRWAYVGQKGGSHTKKRRVRSGRYGEGVGDSPQQGDA